MWGIYLKFRVLANLYDVELMAGIHKHVCWYQVQLFLKQRKLTPGNRWVDLFLCKCNTLIIFKKYFKIPVLISEILSSTLMFCCPDGCRLQKLYLWAGSYFNLTKSLAIGFCTSFCYLRNLIIHTALIKNGLVLPINSKKIIVYILNESVTVNQL